LSALHGPARPILWALQGFLGGQALIATKPEGDLQQYEIWPGGRFAKDRFRIDLQAGTVTCPAHTPEEN
jgi:hypothetical protein